MKSIIDEVNALRSRLPDLEWRLNALSSLIVPSKLPRGLFRLKTVESNKDYMIEIRDQLTLLQTKAAMSPHPDTDRALSFLAEKIARMINVLVQICKLEKSSHSEPGVGSLTIDALMTRQQWLSRLEKHYLALEEEEKAMALRLEQDCSRPEVQLQLRKAHGELLKKLSLAKEEYIRALGKH